MAENRNGTKVVKLAPCFPLPQAKSNAPASEDTYPINVTLFKTRLKTLYSHWRKYRSELWGSSNVLAIASPSDYDNCLKSLALNAWLFGYKFPSTIMVFMNKQIHILSTQKKVSVLKTIKHSAKEALGAEVFLYVKAVNTDGTEQMDAILRAIRAQSKSEIVVGHIASEVPKESFLETWAEKLKDSKLQLGDITSGLSDLFAVKDSDGIINVKKAALVSARAMMDFVVPTLETAIDEEVKVEHSTLMHHTEEMILEPIMLNVKLKAKNVGICYKPIFQSGGVFNLLPNASSNDDTLCYDSASVIICALGSSYNFYCSNIARTFLIDATETQRRSYEVLLEAEEAVIAALKPGNKISSAYQAALCVVQDKAPELVAKLTESAGTGTGLEFCESDWVINATNEKVLKSDMVFNVSLGFQNLQAQTGNAKKRNFSWLLADTVVLRDKGNQVLTAHCSKSLQDVAYSFTSAGNEEWIKGKPKPNTSDALFPKATRVEIRRKGNVVFD